MKNSTHSAVKTYYRVYCKAVSESLIRIGLLYVYDVLQQYVVLKALDYMKVPKPWW